MFIEVFSSKFILETRRPLCTWPTTTSATITTTQTWTLHKQQQQSDGAKNHTCKRAVLNVPYVLYITVLKRVCILPIGKLLLAFFCLRVKDNLNLFWLDDCMLKKLQPVALVFYRTRERDFKLTFEAEKMDFYLLRRTLIEQYIMVIYRLDWPLLFQVFWLSLKLFSKIVI